MIAFDLALGASERAYCNGCSNLHPNSVSGLENVVVCYQSRIQLSDAQLNALAAFLLKLNPDNATALRHAPDFAVQGALVYQRSSCGDCHKLNGGGMEVGPSLNGLAKRRSRSWVEEHFSDPPKYSPGSFMPAYHFSRKDLDNITSYLFATQDRSSAAPGDPSNACPAPRRDPAPSSTEYGSNITAALTRADSHLLKKSI